MRIDLPALIPLVLLLGCQTGTAELLAPADGEVDADGMLEVEVAWTSVNTSSTTVEVLADGQVVGSVQVSGLEIDATVAVDLSDQLDRGWPLTLEARVIGGGSTLRTSSVEVLLDAAVDSLEVLRATEGFELESDGELLLATVSVITAGDDPVASSVAFLNSYGVALGLVGSVEDTLYVTRASRDGSTARVFFAQHVDGVPVEGTHVAVVIEGNLIRHVSLRQLRTLPVSSVSALTSEQAESAGRDAAVELLGEAVVGIGRAQLRWLWTGRERPVLVWRVQSQGDGMGVAATVDAGTGEVLDIQYAGRQEVDLDVMDANQTTSNDCWRFLSDEWHDIETVCDEGGCDSDAHPDADRVFQLAAPHHDWLQSAFGLSSYDGDDGQVEVLIDVGGAANASYSPGCDHYAFSSGLVTEDVFGHELGHGLDEALVDLTYSSQSGALDEHLADIRGVLFEAHLGELDPEVGESSTLGVLRDIVDPTAHSQPDHIVGYHECAWGTGGVTTCPNSPARFVGHDVHTNSGIPNKAVGLLLFGGVHNSITVEPLSTGQVEQIVHEAHLRLPGGTAATMLGYSARMRWAANDFARTSAYGIDDRDVCQVRNAFAAVGLGVQDSNCDGTPDAATLTDADGDGISDGLDNCVRWFNPQQTDTDRDGEGDACSLDIDGDTTPNVDDNCPKI